MKYDDENVNEKLQGLIKPKITGKKTMPVTFSLFLTYCSVVGPTLRSGSRARFCEGGGGANPTAGFHGERGCKGPPPENFSKLNIKYGSYYDFFKVKKSLFDVSICKEKFNIFSPNTQFRVVCSTMFQRKLNLLFGFIIKFKSFITKKYNLNFTK